MGSRDGLRLQCVLRLYHLWIYTRESRQQTTFFTNVSIRVVVTICDLRSLCQACTDTLGLAFSQAVPTLTQRFHFDRTIMISNDSKNRIWNRTRMQKENGYQYHDQQIEEDCESDDDEKNDEKNESLRRVWMDSARYCPSISVRYQKYIT